jgi:hypothetical protein
MLRIIAGRLAVVGVGVVGVGCCTGTDEAGVSGCCDTRANSSGETH